MDASSDSIELRTSSGISAARLLLAPTKEPHTAGESRAIVENGEYQFVVEGAAVTALGPEELFSIDRALLLPDDVLRGRFRPGNFVGTVEITATREDGHALSGWVDVRSRKIDFDSQYRWMLSGVAQDGAELLLRSFSPVQLTLRADHARSPGALYQQVAFLAAIVRRPHTTEAIERLMRSPHISYRDDPIERPVGRGVSGSSRTVRALAAPGPRRRVRNGLAIDSLPVAVSDLRPEPTIDNVPNQYVRFVLDHWSTVLDLAATSLTGDAPADRRGRRELAELRDTVDQWRTDPRFADVGPLIAAPLGNQVISRRPGYREIHQAFVESQAAAMLVWDGSDEVHRAGQQDIAQLYEYWCYLELRRIIEGHCTYVDSSDLVEVTDDGMHLRLKRGRHQVVDGFLIHHGRRIDVQLWFNRSFGGAESWTLQMRPDCSIRFSAQTASGEPFTTWVHLDAKYKVDGARDLFVDDDDLAADDETTEHTLVRKATRADLLKMHAYHDAIRSSAGSYVLFPGSSTVRRSKYGEVLPGIGALPFVPGSDGHATRASVGAVDEIIIDILDHVAHQASSRERTGWWEVEANRTHRRPAGVYIALDRPPADATVLIGFCRSERHRTWVEDAGRYNLRFGERRGSVVRTGMEAAAETLLLWCPDSDDVRAWTLTDRIEEISADELRSLGYPSEPTGTYLLRTLDRPLEVPPAIDRRVIDVLTSQTTRGAPLATTWAAVLDVVANHHPKS